MFCSGAVIGRTVESYGSLAQMGPQGHCFNGREADYWRKSGLFAAGNDSSGVSAAFLRVDRKTGTVLDKE